MDKINSQNLDKLTGGLNYQAFLKAFDERIIDASASNESLSLAFIDIDWFKKTNDEHGHAAGDEVLKLVAKHLVDSLSGIGEVFRYGGDEFAVLMSGATKEQAFLSLEASRKAFGEEEDVIVDKMTLKIPVSLSIGIATYPDDGNKGQEIIRKAGDAVHRAKADGRNKVCLAREERMVTKTSHYTQGQLERLAQLAKREGVGEAVLLREALDDLLRKYTL
jgi:diguanylate cyclase (GGDEF)-like protein